MSNGSIVVIQNCQVIKQNILFEGVPEEICKKKKNRIRLHELSHLLERGNQFVFFIKKKEEKKIKSKSKSQKNRKGCHVHYTIFMIQNLLHY